MATNSKTTNRKKGSIYDRWAADGNCVRVIKPAPKSTKTRKKSK